MLVLIGAPGGRALPRQGYPPRADELGYGRNLCPT
jgi:hypothetical protein